MHVLEIMRTHPGTASEVSTDLVRAVEAAFDCAQTTAACADACLAEPHATELVQCIRSNLECSDIAIATGRLLSRRLPSDQLGWDCQIEALAVAARLCAEDCEQHMGHHEHCRVCADACRKTERAMSALLAAYRPTGDTEA